MQDLQQLYQFLRDKYANDISIYFKNSDCLRIELHSHLKFEISLNCGEGYVDIDCGRYGNTHYHPDVDDMYRDLISLVEGEMVVVWKGYISAIISSKYIAKHPKVLWGIFVKIIDSKGIYSKKEYMEKKKHL